MSPPLQWEGTRISLVEEPDCYKTHLHTRLRHKYMSGTVAVHPPRLHSSEVKVISMSVCVRSTLRQSTLRSKVCGLIMSLLSSTCCISEYVHHYGKCWISNFIKEYSIHVTQRRQSHRCAPVCSIEKESKKGPVQYTVSSLLTAVWYGRGHSSTLCSYSLYGVRTHTTVEISLLQMHQLQ